MDREKKRNIVKNTTYIKRRLFLTAAGGITVLGEAAENQFDISIQI